MSRKGSHGCSEFTQVEKETGQIPEKQIICMLLNTEQSHLAQEIPD